jgi:hypothetical protein
MRVVEEKESGEDAIRVEFARRSGRIAVDLTIGADVAGAVPLQANADLSNPGVKLHGSGFIISHAEAERLRYGRDPEVAKVIKPYRNGRDLTQMSRQALVIDLFALSEGEVRERFPAIYQWIFERVKPERDQNRDRQIRENWWLHGRPRPELRDALAGLPRYIATVETSRHRFFTFLDQAILPDNMLIAIALDDAYFLGVLSSRIHVTWALAAGGTLEDRPRYNKSVCFEPFPFPAADAAQQARIRALGEQLDAHRRRQQSLHPGLAVTDMYNVLEKLRASAPLTAAERQVHEQGLVTVLGQLHDELDDAVAEAYGWPVDLADAEILERLVALNVQRAAEETQGHVRWLRPGYQAARAGLAPVQGTLVAAEGEEGAASGPAASLPWPATMPAQAAAVRAVLQGAAASLTPAEVAARFAGPAARRPARVAELLATLATLGQAVVDTEGRYAVS